MNYYYMFYLFVLFWPFVSHGEEGTEFPVLYQGRYVPAQAYAKRWLHDKNQLSSTPLDALWSLEFAQENEQLISIEKLIQNRLEELQKQHYSPKEIAWILEQEYPLLTRLQNAGSLFDALPGKFQKGEWLPLKALEVHAYHPPSNRLQNVKNFTLFSDKDFEAIRHAYFALKRAISNPEKSQDAKNTLGKALLQAYKPLAGTALQEAHEKELRYPALWQLKLETLYFTIPLIPILIALYSVCACLIFIRHLRLATLFLVLAFLCHTGILIMRSLILERAPVSNMFETILYVPWVATALVLLFSFFRKQPIAIASAALTSIGLLSLLEFTHINHSLDPVPAVLDSQFWLMIHVLLVVGSYGVFALGAILGHFYLGLFIFGAQETKKMDTLAYIVLQTMYLGTILLITGTILGGIWAAQSWGRFWDWDPKESWAFISCCVYLIWIHAYRFHHIASFGLSFGAISGFLAISFTWYGVNYILGTGLHSYGFGSGGIVYYYGFIGFECLFLIGSLGKKLLKNRGILHHP